jgi:hypothetical protein
MPTVYLFILLVPHSHDPAQAACTEFQVFIEGIGNILGLLRCIFNDLFFLHPRQKNHEAIY